MFATDPNTTPRAFDAYKKHYNGDGLIIRIEFYKEGKLQFTWLYAYDDARQETGCEIVLAN